MPNDTNKAEIESPAIAWGRANRAQVLPNDNSDPAQRERDLAAYNQHVADRKARAATKLQKIERPEVSVEEIGSEVANTIGEVESAVNTFNDAKDQPNYPLINARERVAQLRRELAEAEAVLASEEAKGSILNRLKNAISAAENKFRKLLGNFGELVSHQLIVDRLGHLPPAERIPMNVKHEVRAHARIAALDQFNLVANAATDADGLFQRANELDRKAQALLEHITETH